MTYHVYILRSPDGRLYIGQTQDLSRRLREHNDSDDRTTLYTKKYPGPWKLIYTEILFSRSDAIRRERQLKGGQGRQWIKEILTIQRDSKDTTDFISKIKVDVFQNRIFVFSPKGDVFDLIEGSTPIDFAYAVHTEVGNKAVGALINDKMAPLDTKLKNGDVVDIQIEKNRKGPNHDWLKFVKTNRAKEKIRNATKSSTASKLRKLFPGGKIDY